jgi:hypothetical protein
MSSAISVDIGQSQSGIDYSPLENPNGLFHILARYAALIQANALQSRWVSSLTLREDFPIPAPKEASSENIATARTSGVEKIFSGLVKKWQDETLGFSVTTRRYAHPSYHAILLLKDDAVPLILRELQRRPDRWFEALKLLTRANPVAPGSTFEQGVSAWIRWGKENGKIV